jgi:predicted nucleic acid-binding protein
LGKYADQPMDLADACLVAMSEKWWDCKVVTVDVTDFKSIADVAVMPFRC